MACTGLYNIEIKQGNYYALTVTVTDAYGTAIDLTNYSGYAIIKAGYGRNNILGRFNLSFSQPTSGILVISMDATGTAALPVNESMYELEIYPTGSTIQATKYLYGYCDVCPQLS